MGQLADEAAVDLDGIGRQFTQVREVVVAGAEVIDGDPYAQLAQGGQLAVDQRRIAQQGILGDLQLQTPSIDRIAAQQRGGLVGEVRIVEVMGGDVDRHTLALPGIGLADGVLHHPATQGGDQRGLFRQGNEFRRADRSQVRMLPAQQGLDALAAPRGQVDTRLIDQAQLVIRTQGLGQGAEQGEGAAVAGVVLRIEVPAAAHFGAGVIRGGDQGA